MAAPAGWYPVRDGSGERYWDGSTWTDQRRPPSAPPPPSPAFAPPAKPKRTGAILVAIVAFVLGVGVGAAVTSNQDNSGGSSESAPEDDTSSEDDSGTNAEDGIAEEEAPTGTMTKADWNIRVKVREKECFGSAGCIVTFQIVPTFTGATFPDGVWDVTYRVTGGSDGPKVNTFRVEDGNASIDEEEQLDTASSSTVIKAAATRVDSAN